MKFFIFVLILIISYVSWAQTQPFVYDDHGKRDPFVSLVSPSGMVLSYDENLSANDLVLEGIVADAKGHNLAIVNGKVVRVGDKVSSYVITFIARDHVEFLKGTEKFVLKLKKSPSL